MNALGLSVPGAVDPKREAIIDAAHQAYVNYEIYFFSDGDHLRKFTEHPLDYCGPVTDPVTHDRFIPAQSSPRFDFKGKPYFFLSDSTRAIFEANADSLEWPEFKMVY